jgi:hypothetical protein
LGALFFSMKTTNPNFKDIWMWNHFTVLFYNDLDWMSLCTEAYWVIEYIWALFDDIVMAF